MLLKIIFLGFAMSGVLGNKIEDCLENFNTEEMEKLVALPDADELKIVCPKVLQLMDCIFNFVQENTGLSVQELAFLSSIPEITKGATFLINFKNTFEDVCTEGSDLNTAYTAHTVCYSSIPDDIRTTCTAQATEAYQVFKGFEDNVQDEAGDYINRDDEECMKTAYVFACLGAEIHVHCGQSAFDTFKEILKRTTFFQNTICSQEDLQTLKTSFLENLDLEEGRRNIFQLTFDLRRRK